MKIYISKSKVGNPDDLMNLRHQLSKYDCEVTEFMGGRYNTVKLDEADAIILLPHSQSITTNLVAVGKGQFSEVKRATRLNKLTVTKTWLITYIDEKTFTASRIIAYHVNDKSNSNWTHVYGYIDIMDFRASKRQVMDELGIKLKEKKDSLFIATYKLIKK